MVATAKPKYLKSPLDPAREVKQRLEQQFAGLYPEPIAVQMGDPIVDCEGTWIAVTANTKEPISQGANGEDCLFAQRVTLSIVFARPCADTSLEDGTTDHDALAVVSQMIAEDAATLEAIAEAIDSWWTKDSAVGYAVTGGLAITTLSITYSPE